MAAVSSRRSARRYPIVVAGLVLLLLALAPLGTDARQEGPATEPAARAETAPATEEAAGDDVIGDLELTERQSWVIIAILGAGVLLFIPYLVVATITQREAYDVIRHLGAQGISTRIEHIDAWQRPGMAPRGEAPPDFGPRAAQEITFQVAVPDRLVVGTPVEATATVTGVESPSVVWSSPDPSLTIAPQGLNARITGTKPGLYILQAALAGHEDRTKQIPIEVAEPETTTGKTGVAIPFTNAGIATFGVLVFLLALLASLGFGGVIDGDLLMTAITTVVGGLIGAGAVAATRDTG